MLEQLGPWNLEVDVDVVEDFDVSCQLDPIDQHNKTFDCPTALQNHQSNMANIDALGRVSSMDHPFFKTYPPYTSQAEDLFHREAATQSILFPFVETHLEKE